MKLKASELLINGLMRLSGVAPLWGPPPLSENEYKNLFTSTPSFVDYFPVVDYDQENNVFILDDNINVAMGWELSARDLDAKPEDTLAKFNEDLSKALGELPIIDDEYPYTAQFYLQNMEIEDLGKQIKNALPQRLKDDKLSLDVVQRMSEHSEMLTHEDGLFKDSRVSQEKGWRVNTQRIYMVIFRKPPEAYWKKQRKTPTKRILDDTRSVVMALNGLRVGVKPINDYDLIKWLAPIFSSDFSASKFTKEYHVGMRELANYDIGQQCFPIAPRYHISDDEVEQGIYRFGKNYLRYLTTDGLQNLPNDGCLTIAQDEEGAAVWDQLPPGTMMTWTIVPESQMKIDAHIEEIELKSTKADSEHADFSQSQIKEAKKQRMMYKQKIFYTQVGVYLSADSIDSLMEKTYIAQDVIKGSGAFGFIKPEDDLISQDSFKGCLPFVYDFEHDRKRSLRARMTYLSQLASTMPLYGVGKGSDNPCYILYKRSGEPFMYNPYLKSDRSRVAHQLVFGPTGAGKSAAMIYLATMSMAVNGPRQFILDKGNSFGLLADYYESIGKKVRRYNFNAKSNDNFPPFFETERALAEILDEDFEYQLQLDEEDDENLDIDDDQEDDKRSYIAEMLNALKIMITGGHAEKIKALEQSDLGFIQKSLIAGLEASRAANKPHATISDVYEQMILLSEAEQIETFKIRFRTMADSLELWTTGPRGKLFNQIGEGFDSDADLTLIETGALTAEGSEDMFAVAGLATLSNITALGERHQYGNRHIEVIVDEGHYWMALNALINGFVQATKVWRKLGIWLTFATQDFSDFPDHAKKILSQAENWLLLSMGEDEAAQISRFKKLTDEENYLIRQAEIEKPNFSEATLLSKKFGCGLNRFIPPSFILALAQTDKDEKTARKKVMKAHGCSELDAVFIIADQIQASRKEWQNDNHYQY